MLEQLRCFLVQKKWEAEIVLKENLLEYIKIFHLLTADIKNITNFYTEGNSIFLFKLQN